MGERGSVTVWLLGLCVCLLFLGGLSVDLWRVMNARRELVSLADAAAVAGAAAVDEAVFRRDAAVVLDVAAARAAISRHLAGRLPPDAHLHSVVTARRITVALSRQVPVSLLGVLMPGERLRVRVQAAVEPHRRP